MSRRFSIKKTTGTILVWSAMKSRYLRPISILASLGLKTLNALSISLGNVFATQLVHWLSHIRKGKTKKSGK